MNNTLFKLLSFLYYFSFITLFIFYLFPGSLIGFLLYGDLRRELYLISNPIGTSINHLIYFFWITTLALIISTRDKNLFTNLYNIFLISFFLEISHLIVPNRAFEYYDLIGNMSGFILGLLIFAIVKKYIKKRYE